MKDLKQIIGKFGSILAILATVLLVGVLGYFFVYPSIGKISKASSDLAAEKAKVAAIEGSISQLQSEDKVRLGKITKFLNVLIPEKLDMLHFASLNEVVADAAGVAVTNITISKSAPNAAAPAPTTSKAPTTAAPTTQPSVQVAPTTVAVTYLSDFDALLRLIRYWSLADQLVGIKSITINSGTSQISYTVNYDLVTSPAATGATVEDHLTLSEEEKKKIEKLQDSVIYTATPSANPVGKENPFN